jgi:transposase
MNASGSSSRSGTGPVVSSSGADAVVTVGVDPHRRTFTATALDQRGGELGHEHFPNTGAGHQAALVWASAWGPLERVGIEGAGGLGRPLAEFLVAHGLDVRDVPPHKTSLRQRGRHEGKSDRLDSHRIAVETQINDRLAHAFKHHHPAAPDQVRDEMTLWHNARKSLTKIRVQLIGELDALIQDLPEDLRSQLPSTTTARARINAMRKLDRHNTSDPVVRLRLQLIEHRVDMLTDVLAQDKTAEAELAALVKQTASSLPDLVGVAARAAAEIILETGDIRRFTEAGFARFNGTAPLPATSGEGSGEPVRHRLSRGGNRRLNAALHRIAMIQLRCEPRARQLYENARQRHHTRREAMRILKRHLSNIVYRTMIQDARRQPALT